ncbi:family 78 glycoside hydrolase catalytic domain [Microbacterium sp. AZCO]|uniref:family 78 glycoside hydrolase catalytic domain n=1 Tax=Microbacterium sp. AZCO TaxID=3142976 RepID=UPI0031F4146D
MAYFSDGARWIEPHEETVPEAGSRPAHLLRGTAELDRPVTAAVVTATAHGVYELFVNGERVGDQELTPGFTAYRSRLQVQTWDVAALLRPGENVVAAILSDGWFRGRHGFERHADGFGTRTAFIAELTVTHDDGSATTASTGSAWRSHPGHILRADLMDGQGVDFRLLDPDWARPGGGEDGWWPVGIGEGGLYDDAARFIAEESAPVRRMEELAPVSLSRPKPGTVVVDFGQNINGWVRLSRLGAAGVRTVLTHGEVLGAGGEVSTENIRAFDFAARTPLPAGQVDEVISAGRDGDVFEPRHTTHGFRYVQLDGAPDDLEPADLRAVVVHTDLTRVGTFRSSDPRLDALHEATMWSLRDNACDIPTDCPQRERSGFTGDWQIFVATAAQLYDVRAFSEKWLRDLAVDQWDDGRVPTIVPSPAGNGPSGRWLDDMSAGSAGWGDAAVIVPWELWRAYGDLDALRRALPAAVRWVDFAAGAAAGARHPDRAAVRPVPAEHEDSLWDTGFHFGEWLEPGVAPNPDPSVDHGIVATAFLHRSATLLARMLRLAADDRADRYARIADRAAHAWRAEYLAPDGTIAEESQANYARALAFGLIPADLRPAAADRLAALVGQNGGRLTTGFLSTGQLLPALAEEGLVDEAFALLFSTGIPSWLEMVDRGATTVWEWWDGVDEGDVRGSLNHYSKGAVVSFLYEWIAGIRLPADPADGEAAYRRVTIAPHVGGGLTHASATIDTPSGPVASAWRLEDGVFRIDVTVPDGTVAQVRLPDGTTSVLCGGSASYACSVDDRA